MVWSWTSIPQHGFQPSGGGGWNLLASYGRSQMIKLTCKVKGNTKNREISLLLVIQWILNWAKTPIGTKHTFYVNTHWVNQPPTRRNIARPSASQRIAILEVWHLVLAEVSISNSYTKLGLRSRKGSLGGFEDNARYLESFCFSSCSCFSFCSSFSWEAVPFSVAFFKRLSFFLKSCCFSKKGIAFPKKRKPARYLFPLLFWKSNRNWTSGDYEMNHFASFTLVEWKSHKPNVIKSNSNEEKFRFYC